MIDLSLHFRGKVERAIASSLASGAAVPTDDICMAVWGEITPARRAVLRNVVKRMRPKLALLGFGIHGRRELRANAYRLVPEMLN